MKKISIFAIMLVCFLALTGCSSSNSDGSNDSKDDLNQNNNSVLYKDEDGLTMKIDSENGYVKTVTQTFVYNEGDEGYISEADYDNHPLRAEVAVQDISGITVSHSYEKNGALKEIYIINIEELKEENIGFVHTMLFKENGDFEVKNGKILLKTSRLEEVISEEYNDYPMTKVE